MPPHTPTSSVRPVRLSESWPFMSFALLAWMAFALLRYRSTACGRHTQRQSLGVLSQAAPSEEAGIPRAARQRGSPRAAEAKAARLFSSAPRRRAFPLRAGSQANAALHKDAARYAVLVQSDTRCATTGRAPQRRAASGTQQLQWECQDRPPCVESPLTAAHLSLQNTRAAVEPC